MVTGYSTLQNGGLKAVLGLSKQGSLSLERRIKVDPSWTERRQPRTAQRKRKSKKEEKMTTKLPTSENVEEKMTTVIADDLQIKGTITFKTSLMIKGSLDGEIISEGLLVVGSTAKINAAISTKSLISHGEIQGDVTASEQVVLKGSSVHTGKVTTPNIVVENGSVFNGSCVMERKTEETPQEELVTAESDSSGAAFAEDFSAEKTQVETPEAVELPTETPEPSA
ncbi:MAG: hypothetical protein C0407_05725, partial [Desulfobacca sp.]|nr:hypothetical protein [Desulfobacca sp.]